MGRRRTSTLPRPARALRVSLAFAVVAAVLLPALASAHPLGNFTINHYAGLFIEPERVLLDVVIDQAEIPAFTARQAIDADSDGEVTDEELDAGRIAACQELAPDLSLALDGAPLSLELVEAGIDVPPGVGGLPTMRTVCGFMANLPSPLVEGAAASRLAFADGSFPARLGWREIVVVGSGVAVSPVAGAGEVRTESLTGRLTAYSEDLIAQPLADGALDVEVVASADAAVMERPSIDDATPVPGAPVVPPPGGAGASPAVSPGPGESAGPAIPAVPAGVGGGDVPSIFQEAALTPVVLLLSVMTAVALGAGHALTPGHGKTLMAAYLVGTRGRPLHAVGLGLSVSVSHTAGILVLAAIVVGAADVLPADVVVRAAPIVASISILAIGAWMLVGEWRRRRSAGREGSAEAHGHEHAHDEHAHDEHAHDEHEHEHEHEHGDDGAQEHEHGQEAAHGAAHGHDHAAAHEHPHEADHGHEHEHPHEADHGHDHTPGEAEPDYDHTSGEHSHGGIRHSHLPPAGSTITWRSLFVLGLAGGLIPSTSALLILLGSIAAGRTAFGLVLVVAFGLGMAAVMTSIGLVLVFARERLEGVPASPTVSRIRDAVPLVAAVLVFGFGIYLTVQALAGAPAL